MQPSCRPDDVPHYKKTTREINQIAQTKRGEQIDNQLQDRNKEATGLQPTNSNPTKEKT